MTSVYSPLIALLYEGVEFTIQVDNWNCSLFGSNKTSEKMTGSYELVLYGKLYSPRFESDTYIIDGNNLRDLPATIRLRSSEDWDTAIGLISDDQRGDIEKAKGLLFYTSGQIDGVLSFDGDAIKEFYKFLLDGLSSSVQLRFTIRHESDKEIGCFIVESKKRIVSWDGKDGLLIKEARVMFSDSAIREPAQLRMDAHKLILKFNALVDNLDIRALHKLFRGIVLIVCAAIVILVIREIQSRP